jgi:hypothetical protein
LQQGDATVQEFFNQLSAACCELDTLGPQLSLATCESCSKQQTHLELWRTYDFLTHFGAEFEPLRAHLLAREPSVSLMEALLFIMGRPVFDLLVCFSQPACLSWLFVLHLLASSLRSGGTGGLHCGKKAHSC